MKNKRLKIILAAAAAAIVIAAVLLVVFIGNNAGNNKDEPNNTFSENAAGGDSNNEKTGSDNTTQPDDSEANTQNTNEEEKVYTPTFMYFISASDADFEKTNGVIEKLKKEYDGKVNFDIRNVDEHPEYLDNFPVKDQTPALIMLNTKNDISDFLFKNGNYEDLKGAIDKALE